MKWISLAEAVRQLDQMLGISDKATVKKYIHAKGEPKLRALIVDKGGALRYRIKQEWLDNFIEEYENTPVHK